MEVTTLSGDSRLLNNIKNEHCLWVNPLWMAIFNSYVSLPEGTTLWRFQAAEQDEMIGWRWWRCEILWNSPCPRQPYFRHVRWYIVVLSFQGTCRMQKKNTHIYIVLYRLFHIILYSYINIILYMCMYLDKRGKGWLCVCACSCAYMSTHMDYSTHVRTYISTELCPNMFHVSHRCLQLVHSGCQWINLIDW